MVSNRRSFGVLMAILAAGWAGCEDDFMDVPDTPSSFEDDELRPPGGLSALPGTEPLCAAPHGGRLLAIRDGLGYVEWDTRRGRLYFLDAQCRAASGVEDASLYVSSPTGPTQVALSACEDEDYAGACLTSTDDVLRMDGATGVLRFQWGAEFCRVLLEPGPNATQPAGAATAPAPAHPSP
jgi:hypothetical protein